MIVDTVNWIVLIPEKSSDILHSSRVIANPVSSFILSVRPADRTKMNGRPEDERTKAIESHVMKAIRGKNRRSVSVAEDLCRASVQLQLSKFLQLDMVSEK